MVGAIRCIQQSFGLRINVFGTVLNHLTDLNAKLGTAGLTSDLDGTTTLDKPVTNALDLR